MFQSPTIDSAESVEIETYRPFPRQQAFHASPAKYRLFGGAAGPGKSRALVEEGHQTCLEAARASQSAAADRDAKLAEENRRLADRLAQTESDLSAKASMVTVAAQNAAESAAKDSARMAELESARHAVADGQQQLAASERELTALRQQAAAARDLDTRIRQLDAEKSALAAQLAQATTGIVSKAEFARLATAKADAEEKLAVSLTSYSLVAKERDDLAAKLAAWKTDLTARERREHRECKS